MKLTNMIGFAFLVGSTCINAQQNLAGQYSGSYSGIDQRQRPIVYGVGVSITSADAGALKGALNKQAGFGSCRGEVPIEGTYQGNKIEFKSVGAGPVPGCGEVTFAGTVEGTSFVGKWNDHDLKLSR